MGKVPVNRQIGIAAFTAGMVTTMLPDWEHVIGDKGHICVFVRPKKASDQKWVGQVLEFLCRRAGIETKWESRNRLFIINKRTEDKIYLPVALMAEKIIPSVSTTLIREGFALIENLWLTSDISHIVSLPLGFFAANPLGDDDDRNFLGQLIELFLTLGVPHDHVYYDEVGLTITFTYKGVSRIILL